MIYSIQINETPIYRQIVQRVTHLVASGRLPIGEQVPSVRELAIRLTINPMTVSKAYAILTATGILAGKRGGRLCVNRHTETEECRIKMLKPHVDYLLELASDLGLRKDHVIHLIAHTK